GVPQPPFDLRRVLREVLIVPETKPAGELLQEFKKHHTGMAVVVDEFGVILGLATLEDILEQMVGEIHDEFDVVERPLTLADGSLIFDAALNVRDLQTQYNIALPDDPAYETVGGFVLSRLGCSPRGGEGSKGEGYRFPVMEMAHRRISRVKTRRGRVAPPPATPETAEPQAAAPADAETVAPSPKARLRRRRSKQAAKVTQE